MSEINRKEELENVALDEVSTKNLEESAGDAQAKNGFSATWTNTIHKIHAPIKVFLHATTQASAKNPKRTLSIVAAISIFLAVVGLFTNFNVDVDEDKLWTPDDSRVLEHQDWIDDASGFPEETNDLVLFFHSNGENVLGQEQVSRVFEVFDIVQGDKNYNTMCADSTYVNSAGETTCEVEGVVNFWGQDSELFAAQVSSDEEAVVAMSQPQFPDGTRVSENGIFGKPERDATGNLTSALSYTVVIRFPPTDLAEDFEDDMLDILLDLRDAWAADKENNVYLEVTADGSFGDEFERAILEDIPLIPIVFLIMSVFTALVFFKRDKVQSRSLLGFGAVVGVFLSLLSGFGLLFTIGTPFTSMTQILPFVIFGIGLDDAFIMFGAYARTDPSHETTDRIRKTVDEVGISITSTTVTSTLAFGLGCLSSVPAVYWLCMYAFPTIVIIYLYTLTFFVAWIVLDERRIQSNKRDCCFCVTAKQENQEDRDQSNYVSIMDNAMARYAEFLMKPAVKVAVILSFIALAVVGALSASNLEQAFSFTEVMPSGSYVTAFFDALTDYSVRNSIAPFAYFRGVDQSNEDMQQQMQAFVDEIVALEAVEEEPDNFWLLDFKNYVENEELTQLTFNEQLDAFLSETIYFDLYSGDIVRDENGAILTSRVRINFDNIDEEDVNQQIDTLEDQRTVSRRQSVNAGQKDWKFFSYDGIYNIWEFYAASVEELIFTTIMGVVAVTGVALIFIPHWTASLFVLPLISVLYVDLLGVLNWAGVNVNPVSYISLVMSIGLLVDFVMHVILKYYESPGNRREKTVTMLKTMGSSILIGGISTFLGTLPLAFSTSAIFYTIFIAFVGLVTLGIGHGLILLPVVLSIIGPEDQVVSTESSVTETAVFDKEMSTTIRSDRDAAV